MKQVPWHCQQQYFMHEMSNSSQHNQCERRMASKTCHYIGHKDLHTGCYRRHYTEMTETRQKTSEWTGLFTPDTSGMILNLQKEGRKQVSGPAFSPRTMLPAQSLMRYGMPHKNRRDNNCRQLPPKPPIPHQHTI